MEDGSLPDRSSPPDSASGGRSDTLDPVVHGGDRAGRETHEALCFERSMRGAADSVEARLATHEPVSELQSVVAELLTIHRERRNLAAREERPLAELGALLHPPWPASAVRGREDDA